MKEDNKILFDSEQYSYILRSKTKSVFLYNKEKKEYKFYCKFDHWKDFAPEGVLTKKKKR